MSDIALEEDAAYGRLPFDNFLSERWNYNTTEDSQQQWEQLVWEWQSLTLIECYSQTIPKACPVGIRSARAQLSDQTCVIYAPDRIRAQYQPCQCDGWQTVWLRTCYDQDLDRKYEEMKRRSDVPGWGVSGDKILDDPARYNFDDGSEDAWRRVLVHVPGITDFSGIIDMDGDGSNLQYISGQHDEEMVTRAHEDEEQWRELSLAELRIQAGVYLLDRAAIESGLIKILWLDEHGQIAWENRLDQFISTLSRLTGCLLNATTLVELAGYDGTHGALIEN